MASADVHSIHHVLALQQSSRHTLHLETDDSLTGIRRLVLVQNLQCLFQMSHRCDLSTDVVHHLFGHFTRSLFLQAFGQPTSREMSNEPRCRLANLLKHCFGIVFPGKVGHVEELVGER